MRERPSWTDYFLGLATFIAGRSVDEQTQHGCVLTNRANKIVGTGYNSFPKGMNDASLPSVRPDKYPWMIHSERNALANSIGPVEGGIAYVTGECCFPCLTDLHQEGISEVRHVDGYGWQKSEQEAHLIEELLSQSPMRVVPVEPDYSWAVDIVLSNRRMRKLVLERLGVTEEETKENLNA